MSTDVFTCEQRLLAECRKLKQVDLDDLRAYLFNGLVDAIEALNEARAEKKVDEE